MNETDFQALFDSYREGLRARSENPIPPKLHLMVYNYARLRHQQTSDVSADFYLYVLNKVNGILDRYDARRIPFYQYFARSLNFEFSHFLRRRRLPRSQLALMSIDELAERKVELADRRTAEGDGIAALFARLAPGTRIYGKLALALPLTFAELRQLTQRKKLSSSVAGWNILRSYRAFLRFADEKRQLFLTERDRLLKLIMQIDHEILKAGAHRPDKLARRKEAAQKKFFSMDTRIPIRIVAAVTGDSIATAQRQLKKAVQSLQKAYFQWEKQKLGGKKRKTKEAD